MTAKQRREHKYGNAIRAYRGSLNVRPQQKALARVLRAAARLGAHNEKPPAVTVWS
jgi:hypothetical protein